MNNGLGISKVSSLVLLSAIVATLFVWQVPCSFGQASYGGVNGTVTDQSGGVVPGAIAILINQGTQVQRQTTTNTSGNYTFVNVNPGPYVLQVTASGFKKAVTAAFTVGVNQTVSQPLRLALGQVTQTVQVSAQSQMIEPTTTELGTVINQRAVHDLPLNGRNISELLILTPGVTPISTAQGSGVSNQDGGMTGIPNTQLLKPSFHGQQNRWTLYYQDGIINTDLRGNVYGFLPMVDTVQEFKVLSHAADTQFGGVAGGVINIVSKSGTNHFHGDLFEFVRNNAFDARNTYSPGPVAPFRQNDFGGTIGGPVLLPHYNGRDKTFFFFGYEGWRYSQPTQRQSQIPTSDELNGDFSGDSNVNPLYNPYSTRPGSVAGTYVRDPFTCDAAGNPITPAASGIQTGGTPCQKIPSQLISPVMQKFLQAYSDSPNFAGPRGLNFIDNQSLLDNNNRYQVKVDEHFSERDSVFYRWSYMTGEHFTPIGPKNFSPSRYTNTDSGGGWTHVFSPTLLLDVRGGWMNKPYVFADHQSPGGATPAASAGFTGVDQFGGLLATFGGGPWGGPASEIGNEGDLHRNNPAWSTTANLNWIKGNHNFQFGYNYVHTSRLQINTLQQFNFSSDITDNPLSPGASGNSLASALLGFPASFAGQLPSLSEVNFHLGEWGFYMHDQWRVHPKLTLDYGLRYDVATQPTINGNRLSNGLDIPNRLWILGASAYPPACNPPQLINPCILGGIQSVPYSDHIVLAGKKNFMNSPVYDNFGPRIGAAWQLRQDTVLRGNFGLFWNTLSALTQSAQNDIEGIGWPWTTGFGNPASGNQVNNVVSTQPSSLTPITSIEGNFPVPLPSASPWTGSGWADDPHLKDPYSEQWTVDLQHQFGPKLMVSAAYVGSKNGRLPYTGYANSATQASPNGTSLTQIDSLRAMPWMSGGGFRYTESIANSNYNGLQASVQARFTNLTSLISYTWNKCIDESSGYYNVENGAGGPAVQNYFDPGSNRGLCGYNLPNYLSWFTVYNLPFGKGQRWLQNGPASWVLGNWQMNYILQARSGQAYTLGINAGDIANIGGSQGSVKGYGRPNLVGDPFASVPAGLLFNPAAFAIPSGSYGSLGKDTMESPGVVNLDFSVFKNIPLGKSETRQLQLRFEGFNVFNIMNPGVPGTTIGLRTAGLVTSLANGTVPRELQFGARILF